MQFTITLTIKVESAHDATCLEDVLIQVAEGEGATVISSGTAEIAVLTTDQKQAHPSSCDARGAYPKAP